ncbi:MAG: DUF3466 family protein, partial [Alphaproteobacteria bacterium]
MFAINIFLCYIHFTSNITVIYRRRIASPSRTSPCHVHTKGTAMKHFCFLWVAVALLPILLLQTSADAQTPTYSIVDFRNATNQPITTGVAINAQGQVAVVSTGPSSKGTFRTSASNQAYGAVQLPGFGGGVQEGIGINDLGQIAGYAYTDNNNQQLAYRSTGNGVQPAIQSLGTLGGARSYATGINNNGEVTGSALNAANAWHAFRSTPNGTGVALTDIGTLGGGYAEGRGINSAGQIAGGSTTSTGQLRAFRSTPTGVPSALTDMGTLGGAESFAFGVTDRGNVTGYSRQADGLYRAFLSSGNGEAVSLNNLGVLSGFTSSIAYSANASNLVVGQCNDTNVVTGSQTSRGFIYAPGTGMLDLNSLLAPGFESYRILAAYSINDSGEIAAVAFAGGASRAIRLV